MRIKPLIAALAFLALAGSPAHAQQTKAAMTTTIGNCFPTQSVGAITPASVVTCLTTLINSYQQYTAVRTVTGTTDTLSVADYGNLIRYNSASPVAVTLGQATGTFGAFNFFTSNNGTANAVITPGTSTIGGNSSLTLVPGQSAFVVSDGANWDIWQTAQVASSTVFGLVEPDGSTIVSVNGVLTAVGAVASSIGIGTTGITSGMNGNCLNITAAKLGQIACGGTPPGSSGQLVYNGAGAYAAIAGFTSDGTNITAVTGSLGGILTVGSGKFRIQGSGTGYIGITTTEAGATPQVWTIPAVTDTFAGLTTADQTVSGGANITPFSIGIVSSGVTTIDCGKNAGQWLINAGTFTLGAPANDGMCVVEVINGSGAGSITLSNFSGKGAQGATFTTATTTQATVTFTNSSASISWIANALAIYSPVYFSGGTGSLPINIVTNTLYYVAATGTNSIQIATAPGNAAIIVGSTGTGALVGEQPSVFDLTVSRINGTTLGVWTQAQ